MATPDELNVAAQALAAGMGAMGATVEEVVQTIKDVAYRIDQADERWWRTLERDSKGNLKWIREDGSR